MKNVPPTEAIDSDFATGEAQLPDRLPWPVAALVIGGLAAGLWAAIFAVFHVFA